MTKKIYYFSESLVLSLCKEIEYIKNRSKNINYSLRYCQNKGLSKRLQIELQKLNNKRSEISKISKDLFIRNCNDISFQLLFEMCKRSTSFQQI